MEENIKLERIKKSCRAGEIVTTVLCIIAIVACVLALVSGIVIACMGENFDALVSKAIEAGNVSVGGKIGSFKLFDISIEDFSKWESDIPAIQELLTSRPYSLMGAFTCFSLVLMTAAIAVMMKLVGSIFSLIRKENTPFAEKVIRRILIVMIISSVLLFFTSGTAAGLLGGIITWVVYTILDYGRTLQIQSDETL